MTWVVLISIDLISFPTFSKINYLNLILELLLSFIAAFVLILIQKYKKYTFYPVLNIGFYLLFLSYSSDAIDQIFVHTIMYTVVIEKITLFIAAILIIIGSKKWMESYEKLSLTDDLTSLPNRRLTARLINKEILSAEKNYSSFYFAIIDIDFFKIINDQHGHFTGDKVLTLFAELLNKIKHDNDIIGRWGGEEFILVIKNSNHQAVINELNLIRKKIAKHTFVIEKVKLNFTISIGVSWFDSLHDNFKKLFNDADKALYKAKNSGRNIVCSHF